MDILTAAHEKAQVTSMQMSNCKHLSNFIKTRGLSLVPYLKQQLNLSWRSIGLMLTLTCSNDHCKY